MTMLHARQIEHLLPSGWNEIIGNRSLKAHLQSMVRDMAWPRQGTGVNTLVLGDSRSGKTSAVDFAIKAMVCWKLDHNTLQPCRECGVCQQRGLTDRVTSNDLFMLDAPANGLCFTPINGNAVTAGELDDLILEARQHGSRRHLVYIDEIEGLCRRHLDHALYKAVEQHLNITWILSTATTKGLATMFINRFTKVSTEPPSVPAMAVFLAQVCRRPDVEISWDDGATFLLLAGRSRQLVGLALKCLAKAKLNEGFLTRALVEDFPFDEDEP